MILHPSIFSTYYRVGSWGQLAKQGTEVSLSSKILQFIIKATEAVPWDVRYINIFCPSILILGLPHGPFPVASAQKTSEWALNALWLLVSVIWFFLGVGSDQMEIKARIFTQVNVLFYVPQISPTPVKVFGVLTGICARLCVQVIGKYITWTNPTPRVKTGNQR